MTTVPSAVLIGGTRLLIECGEKLLRAGVDLVAIASSDLAVLHWSHAHNVRVLRPEDMELELAGETFDYLLSVVNMRVLPNRVLDLAQVAAINFHDGPLPGMGGCNVPSWALAQGNSQHAISWHLMQEEVDVGLVLSEKNFSINEHSTSLSLMYEALNEASEAFEELIPAIVDRCIPSSREETNSPGRFYRSDERFAGGGVLRTDMHTNEVSCIVRALDFGSFRNPLGLPALMSDRGLVFVMQARRTTGRTGSSATPGRIVSVTRTAITIEVADGTMVFSSFVLPDGATVSGESAAQRLGAVPGRVMPHVSTSMLEHLADLQPALRGSEAFWRGRLEKTDPLPIQDGSFSAATATYLRYSIDDAYPASEDMVRTAFLQELGDRFGQG